MQVTVEKMYVPCSNRIISSTSRYLLYGIRPPACSVVFALISCSIAHQRPVSLIIVRRRTRSTLDDRFYIGKLRFPFSVGSPFL